MIFGAHGSTTRASKREVYQRKERLVKLRACLLTEEALIPMIGEMKRILIVLFSLTVFIPWLARPAYADLCPSGYDLLCTIVHGNTGGFFGSLVGGIIAILLAIVTIGSLAVLIWGAIQWISSGGDKAKVEAARNTIIAAVVGLVIAFLAFAIVNVILFIFTGNSIGSFNLPKLVP